MTGIVDSIENTIDDEVSGGTRILLASATNVGLKRERNEDNVRVCLTSDNASAMIVLADGMGGHTGGQYASETIVKTITSRWESGELSTDEQISKAVLEADSRIHRDYPGSGSTVVTVTASPSHALVAHVGDSRAYLLRDGALSQLTRDHSWVESQVRLGRIPQDEARRHPKRNVLLQAVGTGRQDAPDIRPVRLWPGDLILVCSDGLHGVLDSDEILRLLLQTETAGSSLEGVANDLIEATLRGGAPDNVTVALLHVQ